MIQRIQTIWLLLATILISTWLFVPLAYYTDVNSIQYQLMYNGLKIITPGVLMPNMLSTTPIIIAVIGVIITFLVTILGYKNLKRQQFLCMVLVVINILVLIVFYIMHSKFKLNIGGGETKINMVVYFPFLNIVLCLFAKRAINKDIELLKSVDRIRD